MSKSIVYDGVSEVVEWVEETNWGVVFGIFYLGVAVGMAWAQGKLVEHGISSYQEMAPILGPINMAALFVGPVFILLPKAVERWWL